MDKDHQEIAGFGSSDLWDYTANAFYDDLWVDALDGTWKSDGLADVLDAT